MASTVSKLLPAVSKVTVPLSGALQANHTELLAGIPAWSGSPFSLVAAALLPVALPETPVIRWRPARLSLAGWAGRLGRLKQDASHPIPIRETPLPDMAPTYHEPRAALKEFGRVGRLLEAPTRQPPAAGCS